jgi:hypothetical protein
MPDLPIRTAEHRCAGIRLSLAAPPGAAIRTGFAELLPEDTGATLLARAALALLRRSGATRRHPA